jgi:hypothetical protein
MFKIAGVDPTKGRAKKLVEADKGTEYQLRARLSKLKDDLKEFPAHATNQKEADAVDEIHDKIAKLEKQIKQ